MKVTLVTGLNPTLWHELATVMHHLCLRYPRHKNTNTFSSPQRNYYFQNEQRHIGFVPLDWGEEANAAEVIGLDKAEGLVNELAQRVTTTAVEGGEPNTAAEDGEVEGAHREGNKRKGEEDYEGKKFFLQRSHVPKFGNWESEQDVPYTAYFDKARKVRPGSKMINPNDPEEVLVSSADVPPSKPRVHSEDPNVKGSERSTHELQKNREDGDPKHFVDSPARHDNAGNRSGSDSTYRYGSHGVGSADNRRRPSRQSTGSEHSIERSPLHRQAKAPGRDSPSWEGKSSYDSSHGTPGRSRLRPLNRGDETPEKGASVPKFGEWDENNPASADGYTHIFDKVREEKQVGAAHVSGTPNGRQYVVRNQATDDKAQSCCFCWGKK
ncbi:hypothetical protein RJT34_28106 [Clitoria ternatea]|uniref:RIN4 pathogenic type III effector avirulence factor Avr cleavage site domain-containing protein n=1 Tax=Clitoria ternatea TaxID=43366 RepID=A0AAN9F8H9_CLITE